jgi:aspartate carbamoyltransferase
MSSVPPNKKQKYENENEVPSNLTAVKDISKKYLSFVLDDAENMKSLVLSKGGDDRLKHKILASVFYEPSTRTSCSFQAAMLRLGGSVVCVNEKDSSAFKGESIKDTTQTLASYCDAIVLRHPMKGSADVAVSVSSKPIINAGDGTGEHPTQALLDIFTIKSELKKIGEEDIKKPKMVITLLGDLKNGRTVHSLVRLLSLYPGVKIIYIAPSILAMPVEIINEIEALGVEQISSMTLEEAIHITDVLYVTRIQKERFESIDEYDKVAGSYCVDAALMKKAKKEMTVMHPLPRYISKFAHL